MRITIPIAIVLFAGAASGADYYYNFKMDGFQEVPPADPDGYGFAFLHINDDNPAAPYVDWQFDVFDIDFPIIGAHIHQAPFGQNGGIVVDFSGQLSGSGLVDLDLNNVIANPEGFYVNIHNQVYPGGAIRGQIPAPGAGAVLGLAAAAAARRRR